MGKLDIPPVWLIGAAIAAWLLDLVLPIVSIPIPNWLGWIVFFAGLGWAISANVSLARAKTTPDPRKKPTTLVTSGSFGINRNPIYSGMTVMLIGWGAVLGSLMALLPAVGFFLVINARFTGPEEDALREAFGDAAEEYIQNTRRW
jgi:protein-S-isoprenylcysteine O-methyltransferase Ste14